MKLCRFTLLLLLLTALGGCDKQPEDAPAAAPEMAQPANTAAPAAEQAAALDARTLELLAKADGKDGKVDKTVANCPACSLHMAGKADLSVEVGGYQVHSCSASCKEAFEGDPSGLLAKALGDEASAE